MNYETLCCVHQKEKPLPFWKLLPVPGEAGGRWVVCYLSLHLVDFSVQPWQALSSGLVLLRGAVPSGSVWAGWRLDSGSSVRTSCWVGVVWAHEAGTWKCLRSTGCAVQGMYTIGMSAAALANSPRVLCQSSTIWLHSGHASPSAQPQTRPNVFHLSHFAAAP